MEKSKGKAGADAKADGDNLFAQATNTVQDLEESVVKSTLTFTNALSKGLNTYLDARKESAQAKENGAITDVFVNVAKGVSESVKEASTIITDTADALDKAGFSPRAGEQVRKKVEESIESFRK